MKTIDIHGKPYVEVNTRLLFFNDNYPNGSIKTELIEKPDRFIFKAIAIPDVKNPDRIFTGYAEEIVGSSQINNTSALENCETSAVGRALAKMGIGIIDGIASADEVVNAKYQQNQMDNHVSHETDDNDFTCPLCQKMIKDQRDKSSDGIKHRLFNSGKKMPSFKCYDNDDVKNPTCKFATWQLDEFKAGVAKEEKAPHHDPVTDENLAEAEQMALEAEKEGLFDEV